MGARTLSITTLRLTTLGIIIMLNAIYAVCRLCRVLQTNYVECLHAECRYAECRYAGCRSAEYRTACKWDQPAV
jgi:hypothetical protein